MPISYARRKEKNDPNIRGKDTRTYRRNNTQWEFVAVDGEGSTNPETGKAIYQILSAYGIPGEKPDRTVEERGGLSTVQCLEFLLGLRWRQKKLAIVGFSFTYDVNCILCDISMKKLEALANDREIWIRGEGRTRYRVKVIYKKVMEISRLEKEGTKWKSTGFVRVYDVFGFFQCSFAQALKEWKIGDKAELETINTFKGERGGDLADNWEGWRQYNLIECRLLRELMLRFNETLIGVDIHLSNWWG